jgi:hypothetical protein
MRTRLVVLLAVLFALVGGGVATAGGPAKAPAGTNNLGSYKIVGSFTTTVSPGAWAYAYAYCPAGTSVLGGGERNEAPGVVLLTDSYPGGSTSWVAYVKNTSTTTYYTFVTWAVCGT